MKRQTLMAFSLVMTSYFLGFGMPKNFNRRELATFSQSEHQDSLTITVYVSFTVKESGKIRQPKVEKTECSEYDIYELYEKAINKLEKEALRVIEEMDDLDPIKKTTRFTQPIKMRLPTNGYLRKK